MNMIAKRFTGRISDNDIRLLRTFSTVVKHGGFVAAESELQIGLPSISRYIKDLEIRLGVRLCDRGRRGFALTTEGQLVHEACQKLFDDLGVFESIVRDIHANPQGALRLGLIDALIADPDLPLASALSSFKTNYPNVFFNMTFQTSNMIEQEVMDGTLDIGIVFERRRMEQLNYQFLYEETSNLYCTVDHPIWRRNKGEIREQDLADYEYVGYPYAHGMERLGVEGVLQRTATVNHVDALAMMVQSGRYFGFLPDKYVAGLWCADRFRKVAPETFAFTSRISAISRQGVLSGLVPVFIAHLEQSRLSRVN